MRKPRTVAAVETLGRVRLSRTFLFREFLLSEIAMMFGMTNLPDDPDLAIAAGRRLCEDVLEPFQAQFGRLSIRSGYRAPDVNARGNRDGFSCATNERSAARHIWDQRDRDGCMGAMATVVSPWYADWLEAGGDWRAMAWWVHDHLPYSEMQVFPKLGAFNIGWREVPLRRIESFVAPRGRLTAPGFANHDGDHSAFYATLLADFRHSQF